MRGLYASLVASGEMLRDPLNQSDLLAPEFGALNGRAAALHPGDRGISVSLCGCQEGPVTGVRVRAITASPGRAEVEATFKAAGMPRIMRLLLVGTAADSWRFADLQDWSYPTRPWSARRALALDIATTPGPMRPADTVGRWAGQDCRRDWTDWSWDGQQLSFAAANGRLDVERFVAALPDGFVTETIAAPGARPGPRWEYRFNPEEVRVRNASTGRGFTLKPCA